MAPGIASMRDCPLDPAEVRQDMSRVVSGDTG